MVGVEQSAKALASDDVACGVFWNAVDQLVAKALVRALQTIVLDILGHGVAEMAFAQQHLAVKAVLFQYSADASCGLAMARTQ